MTEQADRFTPYLHEDWRGMIGVTASMRSTTNGEYVRVEVYQSQAARIAELEAENAILRTEKYADAEAIASARNDALREAAHECEQVAYSGKYPQDDQSELGCLRCRDNVLAMIEGATND